MSSLRTSIELALYGSAAILAMKAMDMTIGTYIGNKWYIYLILAIIFTVYARKIAERLGGF